VIGDGGLALAGLKRAEREQDASAIALVLAEGFIAKESQVFRVRKGRPVASISSLSERR
jgi:hypothetical protein